MKHGRSAVRPWITPTLSGTWVDYGAPWQGAGYRKLNNEVVELRGLVRSGTIGTAIFVLPAGFRPAADEYFAVNSNGAFGTVSVDSSGNVTPQVGSTSYVSLAGIHFAAAP